MGVKTLVVNYTEIKYMLQGLGIWKKLLFKSVKPREGQSKKSMKIKILG